jgi:hypothetical protein
MASTKKTITAETTEKRIPNNRRKREKPTRRKQELFVKNLKKHPLKPLGEIAEMS